MALNRRKQTGFVLMIGLLLLVVASSLVLYNLSLGRYQERQAGNYLRSVNAYQTAETAMVELRDTPAIHKEIEKLLASQEKAGICVQGSQDDEDNYPQLDNLLSSLDPSIKLDCSKPEQPEVDDNSYKVIAYIQEIKLINDNTIRVAFLGRGNQGNNQSTLYAYFDIGGSGGNAFQSALLGCEGVTLSGSGKIDSYDSRKGAYGEGNSNGTKAIVSTNSKDGSDISLSGSSPIYGQVKATGKVTASGSAAIHGDVQANGDVVISGGGANVYGDVSSQGVVELTSSGTIHGDVAANEEIVTDNWSSRIDGNATAPVVRTTTGRDVAEQVGGEIVNSTPNVSSVTTSSCDSFTTAGGIGINALTKDLDPYASSGSLSISGGSQTYTLTPDGLVVPSDPYNNTVQNPQDYTVYDNVTVTGFPEPTNVLVLDSFSLAGSANFVVDGGDMTLYVTGDVNIGGGATFRITPGSSLKIVTSGRFNLASGLDVASDSPTDDQGNPILSLYSTYDDSGSGQPGVSISGASDFKGTIFAPDSEVAVTGSGTFYGAAKGRKVTVSGAGAIHYDEALLESTIGTGGSAGGSDNGSWTLKALSYGDDNDDTSS